MLALAGGLCLSMAGVALRHIESADGWQILFYRSIGICLTILLITALRHKRNTVQVIRAVGVRGIVAAVVLGAGSIAYIYAILLTSVANAVFIIGTSPILAAILAWLFLRERIRPLGIVAMVLAFLGIGLMLQDGLKSDSLAGALLALGVALSYAVYLLIVRGARNNDMSPVISLCGLMTAGFAYFMLDTIALSTNDLTISIFLGVVQWCPT